MKSVYAFTANQRYGHLVTSLQKELANERGGRGILKVVIHN
jgi:hypothetical protein